MRKIVITFIFCLLTVAANAQSSRLDANAYVHLNDLEMRVRLLEEQIYNDTVMIERLSQMVDQQQILIDSLCTALQIDQKELVNTKSKLKGDIDGNHEEMLTKVDFLLSQINTKSMWAGLVGIGAILLTIILYIIIRKKKK